VDVYAIAANTAMTQYLPGEVNLFCDPGKCPVLATLPGENHHRTQQKAATGAINAYHAKHGEMKPAVVLFRGNAARRRPL
jgi:hypothetical protein